MKLLMIAEQPGQSGPYIKAACKAGWHLAAELDYGQLAGSLHDTQADAAVLIAQHVDDRVLKAVRLLNNSLEIPVVLYTKDSLQHSIRSAVSTGVAVYVVDCNNAARIAALLEIARVRFIESQQLKKELHKAKTTLAERNVVEKAKGIIMQQRQVNEDAAYQLLRKLAMDRNRRIGEVAGEVIAAARVLI